jgi:hypothetical protein
VAGAGDAAGDGGTTGGTTTAGSGGDAGGTGGTGDSGGGYADGSGLPGCGSGDVTLSLVSDANEYAPGQRPELRLTVANVSGVDCSVDFGYESLTITVANSGDERVWSSDDCTTDPSSEPVAVPAGGSATYTVTWDRRHSTPGCDGAAPAAAPDTYLAEATLAGFPVEQVPFLLDEA